MSALNCFAHIPLDLSVLKWDDLPPERRQLYCDEESIRQRDRDRIVVLSPQSARELANWLLLRIPHAEEQLLYPHTSLLKLTRDSWNTKAGTSWVRSWLLCRGIPSTHSVLLIYDRSCIVAMPGKLLVRYWDSLAWSVGCSVIATDATTNWACLFHQEQYIQFGTYIAATHAA